MDSLLKALDKAGLLAGLGQSDGGQGAAAAGGPGGAAAGEGPGGAAALSGSDGEVRAASVVHADGYLLCMARVANPAEPAPAGPAGPPLGAASSPGGAPDAAVGQSADAAVGGSNGAALHRRLLVVGKDKPRLGFPGEVAKHGEYFVQQVVPSPYALGTLWSLLPWTKPTSLRDKQTTIGLGDRIGLATPGQLAAFRGLGDEVSPVLAQQSIRELDFTGRSFPEVVTDASFGVFEAGFKRGYGGDGDHLKTIPDIDRALQAGMPMITLDLTEVLEPEFGNAPDEVIERRFAELPADFRAVIDSQYADKRFELETNAVHLSAAEARRCAVLYGPALAFSEEVDAHLKRQVPGGYDLEISVDETTTPTLPEHHFFIARELERRGVTVAGVAPRFIGEFQKAIDYIGDVDRFRSDFRLHCEIARATLGHKVSVHSGSDKLSVYPIVGSETKGRFHLKTSGTSWLESLRTIAQVAPSVYRLVHERAGTYFPIAKRAYHIDADPATLRPLSDTADDELSTYLDDPTCRQFLHISYGGLLRDPSVRDAFFSVLHAQAEAHHENLRIHFERHFRALGILSTNHPED